MADDKKKFDVKDLAWLVPGLDAFMQGRQEIKPNSSASEIATYVAREVDRGITQLGEDMERVKHGPSMGEQFKEARSWVNSMRTGDVTNLLKDAVAEKKHEMNKPGDIEKNWLDIVKAQKQGQAVGEWIKK